MNSNHNKDTLLNQQTQPTPIQTEQEEEVLKVNDIPFKEDIQKGTKIFLLSQLFLIIANIHIRIFCNNISNDDSLLWSVFTLLGMSIGSYVYLIISNKKRLSLLENKQLLTNQKSLKWMIVRSVLLFCNYLFSVYAITNLKQITYSLIINLGPILNSLIAPFFIDQKFKIYYLYITLVSFIGILIMIFGSYSSKNMSNSKENSNKNLVLGVFSVILNCFSNIITNYSLVNLSNVYDSYNLILFSSFFGFIIGIFYVFLVKGLSFLVNLPFFLVLNALINGIIMFLVSNFLFLSFKYTEIQKIIYISYIQIPLLTLFGYIYANETLSLLEIIGGSVLFSTILYRYKLGSI